MEGPFSKTVIERFPSVIKALNETCQQAFIYLRLRKTETEISRLLNLTIDDTREMIETVRNELIRAGLLDLIEDPRFVPIHSDDPDLPDLPIEAGELAADSRLIVSEFFSHLKDAVTKLHGHQTNLLRLRYKHQLSAKDILGFCKHIGTSLVPGRDVSELKEQDVFYALNTAVKEVLKQLKSRYKGEESFSTENLKYIFEEIGL
ncbi:MAG: hypothetical protein C4581_11175 [Nitrospiraceae bacterium]|nr:MAG: hypothetical protein C4581_11175 [Nitrospiraceae bacterium]